MSNQCEHGQLARSCELCDLEQQLATAQAENLRLLKEIERLKNG